ncbi:MAG: hypothetical protein P8X74_13160 [Reinekea sp.]|jgi:hypothetical protein
MKSVACWLAIGLLLSLTACVTRSVPTELTNCTYPDSPRTPAPEFICNKSIDGYPVTVLRVSESLNRSVRERIEAVLQSQIQQWTQTWSLEWFTSANDQSRAFDYLQTRLTDEARVVRSRMSPKSQLWLLIGLPMSMETLEAETRAAIQYLNP